MEKNKTAPHSSTLEKIAAYTDVPVPIIFMMSVDDEDVPEKNLGEFEKKWPAIMDQVIDLFQIPK